MRLAPRSFKNSVCMDAKCIDNNVQMSIVSIRNVRCQLKLIKSNFLLISGEHFNLYMYTNAYAQIHYASRLAHIYRTKHTCCAYIVHSITLRPGSINKCYIERNLKVIELFETAFRYMNLNLLWINWTMRSNWKRNLLKKSFTVMMFNFNMTIDKTRIFRKSSIIDVFETIIVRYHKVVL